MRALLAAFVVMVVSLANAGVAMAQVAIAEGQVWTFKEAPSDTARVAIVKIEQVGDEQAVHISVYGLPPKPGLAGVVAHMPFERGALETSLDTLMDEAPPKGLPFDMGYAHWSRARGGVYAVSVSEALNLAFGVLRPTPPPPSPNSA